MSQATITKALLLAGGKGSRLHPLTLELPKPLITIRKKPLINYNLELFARHGVTDMKVLIRPEDRRDYERWARECGQEFLDAGMGIQFIEEPEPMGTLGYLYNYLREWMGDENIFVSNGDEIKNIDLAAMEQFHRATGAPVTVALVVEKERKDGGFVLVRENKVAQFLEKQGMPDSNLMSAGMYLLSPSVFGADAVWIPHKKNFLMFETDLFPPLAAQGKLAGYISEGIVFDCGTFERWERAIREA